MASDAVFRLRAAIFQADKIDLLKGIIVEKSLIPGGDMEGIDKATIIDTVDTWFMSTVKDKTITLEKINYLEDILLDIKETTSKSSISLRKDFKISGTIDTKAGISYMSLSRQVESGVKKGYAELDIIDSIIRAMPPTSHLRKYVEGREDLTLDTLKKIIKSDYNEKSATELYRDLGMIAQHPKETPTEFLIRALELRQNVLFATKDSKEEFKYSVELVKGLFERSFLTGLQDDQVRQAFRNEFDKDVEDEELIGTMNKIISKETERNQKLRKSVNNVSVQQENAEIKALRAEVRALKTMVASGNNTNNNKRDNRCHKCIVNNEQKCDHCWRCGSSEHFSRGCRKRQENFRQLQRKGDL